MFLFTLVNSLSGLFNESVSKHRNNETGIRKAETQPLPRRIRPIILVISLSLLPTLDENLWELPIQFLPRSKNHIQRSLSALLSGQICHLAAAQIGFHPLNNNSVFCVVERRERVYTPGQSAMNVKPSFS